MGLNIQKGNMYPWVTHTWNTVKGKCPHDCAYCYMKMYPQKDVRFDESELKTDLGKGNFIFVGSSNDMWAEDLSAAWIHKTLVHCYNFDNHYLFQSKNPARFGQFTLPPNTTLGITLESNRCWSGSKAPCSAERYVAFRELRAEKMVSIEPIMDFDLDGFVSMINEIKPGFVSIGADSKGHNLPEPPPDKIKSLIEELQNITTVKTKDNLKRFIRMV